MYGSQLWEDSMIVVVYFDPGLDLCQLNWKSLYYSDLFVPI